MNCPICNSKLVVTQYQTKTLGTNYYCMSCELNLVEHKEEVVKSQPKITSTRVNLMLDSIRGV